MPPKKILVADDEKNIAKLVKVNLERAGFEVVVASDGIEALEKVEEEKPDLVVLDIMMPRMDGITVLKKLKEKEETKSIPVVMLTVKAEDEDIFRGWQEGADSYLTKPFNPAEVVIIVQGILRDKDMYLEVE
ncbi:MAG: two-component system response regulator [Armatimonadetes bacterium CG07_land_8_20_14_0_80_40_9]|nr:MAG: two-component system response regulator [Armatimonadetes bacterium CG07_land_8_20_14_0_80_40_9]